jgi:polysaccharide export outer membrane protein
MKLSLSEYTIEPPDLLLVDAIKVIPKPPYKVSTGDSLVVRVPGAPELDPIAGIYPVEPDGTITLGVSYGAIQVAGLTIPEVRDRISKHLAKELKDAKTFVALAQSRAMQQVRGQHKRAIEAHLSQYLDSPEVSVDVAAYNSKIIYVIYDGAGNGQQIVRLPVTGNDTVLDALAQAGGLTAVSSEDRIWVARPAQADSPCDQIMPVDWKGITRAGRTATNYQLLPGDRVYVQAQALLIFDIQLAKIIAPIERLFGITLLGNSTVKSFRSSNGSGTGTGQ